MKYSKPKSGNVFKLIIRNIVDSNRGLWIAFKESSTVHKLIPLEFAVGLVGGILTKFIALEYIILLLTLVMIFTTEVINSAIEEVNDLVTEEKNERVRRSKDLASGSVWMWHQCYIIEFFFFLICHLIHFAWWTQIIPV